MENSFTIKNFRVFDEKGETFYFKPISFLTGTNSSGKSSLTKALLLMHEFMLSAPGNLFDPASNELDFSKSYLKLGGFKTEKNGLSSSNEIVFAYSVSPFCAPDCTFDVEYSFVKAEGETISSLYDNGMLSRIVVRFDDQTILEIHVEGREYKIDTINLSNHEVIKSFEWFYIMINRYKYRNYLHEISDNYDIPVEEMRKKGYEEAMMSLSEYAESLGIDLSIDTLVENDTTEMKTALDLLQPNSSLVCSDLKKAFEKFHKTNSFFFFSVFDESEDLIKECSEDKDQMISEQVSFDSFVSLEQEYRDNVMTFYTDPDYLISSQTHRGIVDSIMDKLTLKSKVSERVSGCVPRERFIGQRATEQADGTISFYSWYDRFCQIQFNYLKKKGNTVDDYIEVFHEIDNESARTPIATVMTHKLYSAFCDYYRILIQNVLCPSIFENIVYLGDSHENVKRVHSLSDKTNVFVSRLVNYLRVKELFDRTQLILEQDPNFDREQYIVERGPGDVVFMNGWLSMLGIGKALEIDIDNNTMAASLMLRKSNDIRVNLADEGYGVYQLVILLLSIETEILKHRLFIVNNSDINVYRRGGPYYFHPVLRKVLLFKRNQTMATIVPTTIVLEEPEANLHPAFQSRLAEILYSAYKETNGAIQFIVETHSEYLIRATQAIVAKTVKDEAELKDIPFVVYYMEKGGKAYDMEYQVSGRFNRSFGTGFFDEAGKSAIEILKKERRMNDGSDA